MVGSWLSGFFAKRQRTSPRQTPPFLTAQSPGKVRVYGALPVLLQANRGGDARVPASAGWRMSACAHFPLPPSLLYLGSTAFYARSATPLTRTVAGIARGVGGALTWCRRQIDGEQKSGLRESNIWRRGGDDSLHVTWSGRSSPPFRPRSRSAGRSTIAVPDLDQHSGGDFTVRSAADSC